MLNKDDISLITSDAEQTDLSKANKNKQYHIRLTKEATSRIDEIKKQTGASYNEIFETLANTEDVLIPIETQELLSKTQDYLRDNLFQLKGMANNLNQIARVANSTGNANVFDKVQITLDEIYENIKEVNELWQHLKSLRKSQRHTKAS